MMVDASKTAKAQKWRAEQYRMIFSWRTKLPVRAATLLLATSLSFAAADTDSHPAPEHHKAPKATHHKAPKAARHEAPKAGQHPDVRASHPETPKRAQHSSKKSRKKRTRGQQAIDSERARQIQEALVREHYMNGEASGTWDSATQEAMRRYQADQGWQSKTVPDSRALIRLGLGPDHEHLLNPETAMTSPPPLPHASQSARMPMTTGASAAAAGSNSPASSQDASSISAPAVDTSPTR
jgi:hypothetical protein